MQSFRVCLQINCVVTKMPKHFQFSRHFFFKPGPISSGLQHMIFHKMSPRLTITIYKKITGSHASTTYC